MCGGAAAEAPNNALALAAFTAAVASNTTLGLLGATAALDATCVTSLEVFPPEGDLICGGDPGEPGYAGFGVLRAGTLRNTQYSTPAVPGVASPGTAITTQRLFDPSGRGTIAPRNAATGAGGLHKPSLRVPEVGGNPNNPNYLANTDPNNVAPSNENDYVRDRTIAA